MKCFTTNKQLDEESRREYKRQYYLKHIQEYTLRNRIASHKRSKERIKNEENALWSSIVIYKLKYLLDNLDKW